MEKFTHTFGNYATALLCAAVLPLMFASCEKDKDSGDEDKNAVTGIQVTPASAELSVGETLPLTVEVLPANAGDKSYSWSSSDESVAIVENDVLTALSAGTATVTATTSDGGYEASCTVTVTEQAFDGHVATSAGGYYFGDQWGTGYDNDYVYFLVGDAEVSGLSLQGDGMALWLDLNIPATGATTLPAGTYTALLSDDQDQSYTWLPGTDMGAWGIIGSFVYVCENGSVSYIMAETGTVEIELSDSAYTMHATIVAGGEEYVFSYQGSIELEDGYNAGSGDDDVEYATVELDGVFTQGEMDYYGQAYGDTGTDYANWTIYLVTDSFDFNSFSGSGHMLQLEVNTASSVTSEITPGTYEVFTEIETSSFVPFSAVPGFTQNGYCLGTWYIYDMNAYYGATSGTAVISREGDNYTIEFEFVDDTYMGIFKGSYTGPLSYYDGTAYGSSASVMKAGTATRMQRRAVAPRAGLGAQKHPLFRK